MDSNDKDTYLNSKIRARGIKASPAKLRAAQHACGFKSLTEIAAEIQQLENLDTPPRTMVGRVFRGEAVDPISLERVAKALKVESWSIYLDSLEAENVQPNQPVASNQIAQITTSISKSKMEKTRAISRALNEIKTFTILIAIGLCLFIYFYRSLDSSTGSTVSKQAPINFDNKVIVILPIDGPRGNDITQQLQQLINDDVHWVSSTSLYAGVTDPLDLVRQNNADLVLSGKTQQIGRNIIFQLFATEGASSRQIWADSFSHVASNQFIKNKIDYWLSLIKLQKSVNNPSWDILQSYLKGLSCRS